MSETGTEQAGGEREEREVIESVGRGREDLAYTVTSLFRPCRLTAGRYGLFLPIRPAFAGFKSAP